MQYLKIITVTFGLVYTSLAMANEPDFSKDLQRFTVQDSVGYSVLISQKGQVLFQASQGLANIELNVPMQPDHIFEIGSLTKQFTAVAILLLAQDGQLSLDDNIALYIPGITSTKGKVTLRHLLAHSSGLVDPINNPEFLNTRIQESITLPTLIKQFKNGHWQHVAGEQIQYSNVGYSMLAWVIEKVTGLSYENVLKTRIFTPLKMGHSSQASFNLTKGKASGYTFSGTQAVQRGLINLNWAYGAADLLSSSKDLSIFTHALMQGKILKHDYLQRLLAPIQLNDREQNRGSFTYSLDTIYQTNAINASGSTMGFSSHAMYFADSDTYLVVLSNSDGINGGAWVAPATIAGKLAATLFAWPIPSYQKVSIDKDAVAKYLGRYQVDNNTIRQLSFEQGQFYYQRNDGQKYQVTPMDNDSFYFPDTLSYFTIKNAGRHNRSMAFYYFLTEKPELAAVLAK